MPSMDRPSPFGRAAFIAVAVLALAASWPWLGLQDLWPMAPDTGPWIERGDPASEGWREWVFGTRHFQVGYRPVTALTFTMGTWLGGSQPWVVRGTDLVLHLAAACLLFGVLLRALGGAQSPATGPSRAAIAGATAGLLVFLLHPAVGEVVPWSARRSYSAALAFGCAGLLVASGAATSRIAWIARGLGGGLFLGLALLSNEVAVVPVLFLPVLVLLGSAPSALGQRLVLCVGRSILPAAGVAGALLLRQRVVGGLGGYAIDGDAESRSLGIASELLGDLSGARFWADQGLPALPVESAQGWACLLALGLGASAWVRCEGARRPGAAMAAIAGLLGAGVLFVEQGVWFPRQTHALLAPLALGVGVMVRAAWSGVGPLRIVPGLAAAGILGVGAVASPVLHGVPAAQASDWARRQGMIDTLLSAEDLEAGARVLCVLPYEPVAERENRGKAERTKLPRDARQPLLWVRYRMRGADVKVREFLYVAEASEEEAPKGAAADRAAGPAVCPVQPVDGERRPSVKVPLDRPVLLLRTRNPRLRKPEKGELEALPERPPGQGGADYLYLYDRTGGQLVPAPTKPAQGQ